MLKPSITFVICRRGRVLRRETYERALIRIGRHRSNHLQIEDDSVSKRHAIIEVTAERITVSDLAEEPGLRVNGQWIDEATLVVGDRIQIGATEIVLEEFAMVDVDAGASPAGPSNVIRLRDERARVADAMLPVSRASAALPAAATHGYALLRSGPAVRTEEVELAHVLSAEVSILWGDNVLQVTHLAAGQAFHVGDEQSPAGPCDFLIPREKLGVSRMPLVLAHGSGFALVIAAHALGHVCTPEGTLQPLEAVRAGAEAFAGLPGARLLPLTLGTRAELRFGDISFRISAVRAGKPVGHGLAAGFDAAALPYFALSALSFGGLLSSMAFLVPPLALLADESLDEDRLYMLQAYLNAAAEREQQSAPGSAQRSAPAPSESGARAAGEEGALGKAEAPATSGRLAIQGPAERQERQLSRSEALAEAREAGMIGVLNSALAGDEHDLMLPFTADQTRGSDAASALGGFFSPEVGDTRGTGLALSGTGQHGGGRSNAIGLGTIGTLGPAGSGKPGADVIPLSVGRLAKGHRTGVPRLREGVTKISGRLPPDTIQRVVRQNHPRFRLCYEKGLMTNPNLTGRVGVRFVIGADGRVTHVADGGSDLPDPKVISCVSRAFYDIGFPKPEGGIVTVVYPIVFQPD
jgi:hypothetical protein